MRCSMIWRLVLWLIAKPNNPTALFANSSSVSLGRLSFSTCMCCPVTALVVNHICNFLLSAQKEGERREEERWKGRGRKKRWKEGRKKRRRREKKGKDEGGGEESCCCAVDEGEEEEDDWIGWGVGEGREKRGEVPRVLWEGECVTSYHDITWEMCADLSPTEPNSCSSIRWALSVSFQVHPALGSPPKRLIHLI